MGARSAVALEAAGDYEDLVSQIDHHRDSSLSHHQKLALALTDAYLIDPETLTAELRVALLAAFTPEQIVEIVLRVAHHSRNRLRVALGTDDPDVRFWVYAPE